MKRLIACVLCCWSLFVGICLISAQAWADNLVLKAHISEEGLDLPVEMYGNWFRHRTLLESTFPQRYETEAQGSWVITRAGSRILLLNPENGASSEIIVQAVEGNTATFQYRSHYRGMACVEELSLEKSHSATQGDLLRGYQEKVCSPEPLTSKALETPSYHALARVEAIRLDGTTSW